MASIVIRPHLQEPVRVDVALGFPPSGSGGCTFGRPGPGSSFRRGGRQVRAAPADRAELVRRGRAKRLKAR